MTIGQTPAQPTNLSYVEVSGHSGPASPHGAFGTVTLRVDGRDAVYVRADLLSDADLARLKLDWLRRA